MSFLKSPFRKKGPRPSFDEDFPDEQASGGQKIPPKFGGPGGAQHGHGRAGGSPGARSSERSSGRRTSPPPLGKMGSTDYQSPRGGSFRNNFRSPQGRSSSFEEARPNSHSGRSPRGRAHKKEKEEEEDEQAEKIDEAGNPLDWSAKPSRERRFTMFTRPELHGKKRSDDGDHSDEDFSDQEESDTEESRRKEYLLREVHEVKNKVKQAEEHIENLRRKDEEEEEDDEKVDSPKRTRTKISRKLFRVERHLLLKGWMWKKGKKRTNWRKRWFQIENAGKAGPVIKYYSDENAQYLKGVIPLKSKKIEIPRDTGKAYKAIRPIENQFHIAPQHYGFDARTYHLCTFTPEDKELWLSTLEEILLAFVDHQKTNSAKRQFGKGRSQQDTQDEEDEEEATRKYDMAQNWNAYGSAITGGRLDGNPVQFTIQANDLGGEPDENAELFHPVTAPHGHKLSVVIESEEFHIDADIVDNENGTFTASYYVPCVGSYELSVMLDGYDIYGSPFYPAVEPAAVCSRQCTAEGPGLICAVVGEQNEFTIHPRSYFDEPIEPEGPLLDFRVEVDAPLKFESITRDDETGDYKVVYSVEPTADLQGAGQQGSLEEQPRGNIHIRLDDHSLEELGIVRHIKDSPFCPLLTDSANSEDFAAAQEASAFLKVLENQGNVSPEMMADLRTKLTDFAKLVKNPQLMAARNQGLVPYTEAVANKQLQNGNGTLHANQSTSNENSAPRLERFVESSSANQAPMQQGQNIQAPQPPAHQQQSSAYLPIGGAAPAPSFLHFPPSHQNQTQPPSQQQQQQWRPQGQEASMVRESLEERAYDIEREKQELVRKRRELDESRLLIDERVRRMAEIGRQVHADSERVVREARSLKEQHQGQQQQLPAKENSAANSPYSSPAHSRGSPKKNTASNGRGVLLDEALVALFDKHSVVLSRVFEYYRSANGTGVLQLSDMIRFAQNYEITPTLISRKEIREIYEAVASRSPEPMHSLSFQGFLETFANIAVHSLSKPMFAHLYKTNIAEVNALLTMYKVADPVKLSEIQEADLNYGF